MWFRIWSEKRERSDLSCRVSMDQNGSSGGGTLWEMFSWHTLGSFVPTELHFSRCCLCASPSHYNQIIPAVCIAPHAIFENQIQMFFYHLRMLCGGFQEECWLSCLGRESDLPVVDHHQAASGFLHPGLVWLLWLFRDIHSCHDC